MMNDLLLDRYKINSLLNAGSFSTIYLAQALTLAEKPTCILKQFKPQSDDLTLLKVAKELFEREAKVLRQIGHHPQIPQILDYFEADGVLYLVQEYIEGETLREFQHHSLWNEQQIVKFLRLMLPVLAFIHQQGIIHRDIKPENVILRSTDQKPFLIDFGAVKLRSQPTQTHTSPTIIHSYGYTPPEQLAGHAEENSDLYALGMTCIEMLLGEKPVSFAQGSEDGKRAIQKLEELAISDELRSLLNQLVYVDVRQRYQSANAAIADLNQLKINHESVRSNGYTPTLISCFDADSANLKYTPTQLSLDSVLKQPIGDKTQNLGRSAANSRRQSVQPQLLQIDPKELGRELTQCLNHKNPESQIRDAAAVVKATLVKYSAALLLSTFCVAIGSVSLYFFYFKASSTQSATPLSTASIQEAQTLLKFQAVAQLQSDTSLIQFLKFTAQGQSLISASELGLIQLYDLQTQTAQQLVKTSSEVLAVAHSQQEILAFATADRSIEIWNPKTKQRVQRTTTEQLVWSLAVGGDRSSLVTGGLNTLQRWNAFPTELKLAETFELAPEKTEPVRSITLSTDGSILAAGNATGELKVVHFEFDRTQLFHAHTKAINAAVMNASETILLTGSDDDTIRVWNLHTLQEYERPVIQAELGRVTAIAPHPNSNIVAAGGIYGAVKLWNWQTGQLIGVLSNSTAEITALAFSPDGNRLAVGTRDGKTTIFSIIK
ncbi:serine/threonine-protein kinase [Microcoleus sp. FACHB-1515]|uniref:serine/threonine-protein kinase n=1 Tax=Cyanophyceae TaxID=3028117 RepID=UPI0016831A14|nr:serine/threonine-protein kinase [Microcoleus sp. FACHB-1515]